MAKKNPNGETTETFQETITRLNILNSTLKEENVSDRLKFENAVIVNTEELRKLNMQLIFKNIEKEKRAAELLIANTELRFQNSEKEKRAAELFIANEELFFQNMEKEKRAAELIIANKELVFQNEEKEKRAAELFIANEELVFQNIEKGKRAAELIIANKELVFQNEEKEKRAAELFIANEELFFQNMEKGKRAAELIIANKELVFQNEEKEKRANELLIANKDLESFNYISSHDLQEPLRKIQMFAGRILQSEEEYPMSAVNKGYFSRIQASALRMQTLIEDLLAYSHAGIIEPELASIPLCDLVDAVKHDLSEILLETHAVIDGENLCEVTINFSQFKQVMHNLIGNSLKYSKKGIVPHIVITSKIGLGRIFDNKTLRPKNPYCHIRISDNGIGFNPKYKDKIFQVFQRLHGKEDYSGTGIGLSIVKKIIENHKGVITASSKPGEGAAFDIYLPVSD